MDMICTGRSVGADEARAMRLTLRVVSHDRLIAETVVYAEQIAVQPPIAVQFAKRILARSLDNSLVAQLDWNGHTKSSRSTPTMRGKVSRLPRASTATVQRTLARADRPA